MRQVNDIYWDTLSLVYLYYSWFPELVTMSTQRNGVISPSDTSNPQETVQMRVSTAVTTKVIRPSSASP